MDAPRLPIGQNCLRTPAREHGFEPLRASYGAAPEALNGTLYRVGPGRFEDAAGPYGHWFDGEGLLTAIRFRGGEVSAACRMIVPAGAEREDYASRGRLGRAPRGLARRVIGYVRPDGYVNVANTALMEWQGRLFALFEAGLPTEVDRETLETLGETELGVVRRSLGAQPQPRAETGELINQGFSPAPFARVDYYALPEKGAPRQLARAAVSDRFPAHDLAVAGAHAVTVMSPLFVDIPRLLGGAPVSRCLRWRPERGTEVVVAPLNGGAAWRASAPAMLYSHTAHAFEEDGVLVVQGVAAADASLADWTARVRRGCKSLAPSPSPGRLTEIRIDLETRRVSVEALFEAPLEFPAVDPRRPGARAGVVYAAGWGDDRDAYSDFYDAVLRFDLTEDAPRRFEFGHGHAVSEPVFVPGGEAEGEGWLLCVNYDAHADRSCVMVLEAGVEMKLVATLPLPQPLPMSLHGLWSEAEG